MRTSLRVTSSALVAASLAACAGTPARTAPTGASASAVAITEAQIEAAQRAWCDALLEISRLGATGGDARAFASQVLSTAYDYDEGTVLFKPTLTFGAQTFRTSKAGALAYFVGGDPAYPDDSGFALKPWVTCRPDIEATVRNGDLALAMGNVYLTDKHGKETKVDKSFGYRRTADGALRIVLHHSSLPYAPAP